MHVSVNTVVFGRYWSISRSIVRNWFVDDWNTCPLVYGIQWVVVSVTSGLVTWATDLVRMVVIYDMASCGNRRTRIYAAKAISEPHADLSWWQVEAISGPLLHALV